MIEFYPQIKHAHMGLALCSGTFFALRGAGALAGMRWPHWAGVRVVSYAIDTALLTAALMLLTILPAALYANGWLVAKLAALLAYIALGVLALGRARGRRARALCYGLALLAFAAIYGIARSHHPWGWLAPLFA